MNVHPEDESYFEGWDASTVMHWLRDGRFRSDGRLLVDCDDRCDALLVPGTLDEYKAALEHWMEHGVTDGCSHGR